MDLQQLEYHDLAVCVVTHLYGDPLYITASPL